MASEFHTRTVSKVANFIHKLSNCIKGINMLLVIGGLLQNIYVLTSRSLNKNGIKKVLKSKENIRTHTGKNRNVYNVI